MKKGFKILERTGVFLAVFLMVFALVGVNVHAENETNISPESMHVEDTDTTAPLVEKVTLGASSASKGGSFTVTLDVVEAGTGITTAYVYLYTYNDNERSVIYAAANPGEIQWYSGQHVLTVNVPSNCKSGNYFVGQVDVKDAAGNETSYFYGGSRAGYTTDATGSYIKTLDNSKKCYIAEGATVNVIKNPGDDETAPRANSVSFSVDKVNAGGTFNVNLDVTEEGTGLKYILLAFYSFSTGEEKKFIVEKTFSGEKSGVYSISVNVPSDCHGEFLIDEVQVYDLTGNHKDYFSGSRREGYYKDASGAYLPCIMDDTLKCRIQNDKSFEVIKDGDVKAPVVDYISAITTEVIKPDVAKVSLHVVEDEALDYMEVSLYKTTNSVAKFSTGRIDFADGAKTGDYIVEIPIQSDYPSGTYRVGQIDIYDKAGNTTTYFGGFLESEFPKDEKGYYLVGINPENKAYMNPDSYKVEVKDEFDVVFEYGLSNPQLLTAVNQLKDGETGQIRIDQTTTVQANVFEAIKGRNVNLVFMAPNYRWLFNGLDISSSKDIVLSINMMDTKGLVDGEIKSYLKVEFAENGVLPGKAQVRVRSDFFKKYRDNGLNLYYLNPQNGSTEYEKDGNVSVKGASDEMWGRFNVEHNSTFLVVNEGSKENAEAKRKQSENITAFATRMYTVVLNRNPDPSGLNNWVSGLASGTMDGASLARGFICSVELAERNLSNEAFVDVLYRTFFNREGDPDGKAYWINSLSQGNSRTKVLAGFVNSVEFGGLCDTYGIARGTLMEDGNNIYNKGVRDFVLRNYSKALGRRGETAGVEDWSYRINTGNMSALDVAMSFFHSEEFLNKNLSNDDYVEVLYETFLGRASDAGGKADWVGQLNGGANRDDVMKGFAYSNEFKEIMSRYGL